MKKKQPRKGSKDTKINTAFFLCFWCFFAAVVFPVRVKVILKKGEIYESNLRHHHFCGGIFLKFSLGNGYIPEAGKFQYSQSFSRFDETFDFEENREGNRIVWNTYSVTLNKVLYGNAKSSSINENDFEDK